MPRLTALCLALSLLCCGGGQDVVTPSAVRPASATSPAPPFTLGLVDGPVVLLEATPGPGGTLVVEGCQGGCTEALAVRIGITLEQALPTTANVTFELLDELGQRCAFDLSRSQALVPGQQSVFETSDWSVVSPCVLPFRTTSLRASLIGDQMGRPVYAQGDFQVSYDFVEPPPASQRPTPPSVLALDWDAEGPTGYHACPLPGDRVFVNCTAKDDDGDPLTLALRLENLGPGAIGGPSETVESFGASPYERDLQVMFVLRSATRVRVTCEVEDARGRRAARTLTIPCA